MAKKPLPLQDRLNQLLDYNPDTGLFLWRSCPSQGRKWNSRCAGKPAICTENGNGYLRGIVDGVYVYAHRLAWKITYGVDPEYIDHINGNRADNRIANLRSVSQRENARNAQRPTHNSSGVVGVHWYKAYGMWSVYIGYDPRTHLGYFHDLDEAIAVRINAERELGYHENHGRA